MRLSILPLIILLLFSSCSKSKSPLELYVEQTNKQCPTPIHPHSKSNFMGITLTDTTALFAYSIHDEDVDWLKSSNYSTLRKDISAMLTSQRSEMQELLSLLKESGVSAQFSYQSATDPSIKLLIKFTEEQIAEMLKPKKEINTPPQSRLTDLIDSLKTQLPLTLTEGETIENIQIITSPDTTITLTIQLPEEPFMALRLLSQTDNNTQKSELLHTIKNSPILPLFEIIPNTSAQLQANYIGVTSKDTVNVKF